MRHTFHNLRHLAMAVMALPMALLMSACNNEEKDAPTLHFPETQVMNCTAGETQSLSFEAEADWKLTSSQCWCKFVQEGEEALSTSGKAGKQTVTLKITDEGLTQGNNSIARLTLYMQGQAGIVAELTRSAAGYELKAYDMDGNEIDHITVGYNNYEPFQIKANFAFAATSLPDWVELRGASLIGAANRMTEGAIRVIPNGEIEKYEQEGTILFQDMKGMVSFNLKVVFAGMDRDAILINQPGNNAWNWKVNATGQIWTHENNTYDRFIECSISAYHDDYEIVFAEENEGHLTIGCDWLHFNKTTGRLTADETDCDRKAYVLAFPRAVYNEITDHLAASLFETEDGNDQILYRYQQNNLVAQVTQEIVTGGGDSDEHVGFVALCFDEDWNQVWFRCNRVTDKAMVDRCEELTGCRELYLLNQPSPRGHYDQIRPWPQISEYESLSGESAYFMDKDGNRIEDETPELSFSDTETPNYWYIMGVHNTTEPVYLVLLDAEGKQVQKVLLIDTKEDK